MTNVTTLKTFLVDQARGLAAGVYTDMLDVVEDVAGMDGVVSLSGEVNTKRAVQLLIELAVTPTTEIRADQLKHAVLDKVKSRLNAAQDDAIKKVKEWVNTLKGDLLAKIPEGARPLLQQLDEIDSPHRWPVKIATGTSVAFSEGIGLDLAASAGAEMILGVQPVSKVDLSPAFVDSAYQLLLRASLAGKLDARIDGRAFFGGPSATFGASAEGQINFDYYFLHRAERLLIQALLNDLRALPSPFSLEDISVAGTRQLAQLRLGVTGALRSNVKASASHAFVGTAGELGGTALPVSGGASLTFSGEITRSGDIRLRVTPVKDGWVRVGIRYGRSSAAKAGLEISAGLNISDIDKVVAPLLADNLPTVEPVLEMLDDLSNPGGWIRDKLGNALNLDDGLRDQVGKALLDPDVTVSDVLGKALEDAVNLSAIDWTGDVQNEAKKVLARLTMRLPFGGELAATVRDWIEARLDQVVIEYVGEIEERIKGQTQAKLKSYRELLTRFDVPESEFDDILGELNTRAIELLEPIKNVVTRYQAVRAKIIAAVEGTTSLNLRLAIGKMWSRLEKSGGELDIEFRADSAEARKIYRAALHGDLSAAIEAVRTGENYVRILDGVFTEYLKEESKTYLNLSVMDGALSTESFARSEIQVSRDITGTITIFAGRLESGHVAKIPGRKKSARFFNNLVFAAQAAEPGKRFINTVGVTLSFADEELESSEIKEYLTSGTEAGLLSEQVANDINAMYEDLIEDDESKGTAASVELAMNLAPDELRSASAEDPAALKTIAMEALWEHMPATPYYERLKNFAVAMGPTDDGAENLLALRHVGVSLPRVARAIQKQYERATGSALPRSRMDVKRWFSALAHMVDLARGFARGVRTLNNLTALDPNDQELTDQANALQKQIASDFEPWMYSNALELIWDNQIPRRNLSLVHALAKMTNEEEPLTGVVSVLSADGGREDKIVTPHAGGGV